MALDGFHEVVVQLDLCLLQRYHLSLQVLMLRKQRLVLKVSRQVLQRLLDVLLVSPLHQGQLFPAILSVLTGAPSESEGARSRSSHGSACAS